MSSRDADDVYPFLVGMAVGAFVSAVAGIVGGVDGIVAVVIGGHGLAVVGAVLLLLFGPPLTEIWGGSDE